MKLASKVTFHSCKWLFVLVEEKLRVYYKIYGRINRVMFVKIE